LEFGRRDASGHGCGGGEVEGGAAVDGFLLGGEEHVLLHCRVLLDISMTMPLMVWRVLLTASVENLEGGAIVVVLVWKLG
jgi:hypothetical protein